MGTAVVGVGIVASGVFTYASLAVARRSLSDESYSAFAVLWGLLLILGPGWFQPLQQEIARATSDRAARGAGSRPVLHKATAVGALQLALVVAAVIVAWPLGLNELLHGHMGLLVALLVSLAGYMATELVRGVLSGRRRFTAYGYTLGTEGAARFAGVALFAVIGSTQPANYAFAVAAGFIVGAATGLLFGPRPFALPGPAATWAEVTPALGLLLTMALAEAFLLNIGPAAASALSDSDTEAGRFLNALVIARLPLFLFQAVRIALLPSLAALASAGDLVGVHRDLRRLLKYIAVLVGAGVIGGGLVGANVVELMFGDQVTGWDMALLSAANGGSMLVTTLAVALVALGRSASAAASLVLGVLGFCLALTLPIDVFVRIELALVAGFAISGAAMAVALRRSLVAAEAIGPVGGTHVS